MLGLLYLILCIIVGFIICSRIFPELSGITHYSYDHRPIALSPYLVLFPAWFITGTLALTWPTYLIALLCARMQKPLTVANIIVMLAAFILVVIAFYQKQKPTTLVCKDRKAVRMEMFLIAGITLLSIVLMWLTFFIVDGRLYIGNTVFSDFSPHLGMIRSFSYGNNFPTSYSHYGGEDIKYHFMFQFLVGNLEYLGLRLDYAFNLPSMLSLISALCLLYVLAVKITAKLSAGVLSCLFFAFRSSSTLFLYLSKVPKGTSLIKALVENKDFIASTPNEDWGLWNLNVYCNQRHLAFGLVGFLLVILLLLPHLYEMLDIIQLIGQKSDTVARKERFHQSRILFLRKLKTILFTKEGWAVKDVRQSIALGILLGSLSFFNGATVIGCLLVLFVVAILSGRRLEFLIVAVIAVGLSLLQTKLFIDGSAVTTQYLFGFIAENKTLFGALDYLLRLLGVLPLVLLVAFCLEDGVIKHLILAFLAPLVFAFTISLTVDVTVNHKYIMMSCILLSIIAAHLVTRLFILRRKLLQLLGGLLILMLTATGIYDFTVVLKKNGPSNSIILNLEDELTRWVANNSNADDIFLTSNYAINQVVLGGAMLYQGWQYFAWSAGYDTVYRDSMVQRMYEASTPEELKALVTNNRIRYIIVDKDNRDSQFYRVNEENISATYELVYTQGQGEWRTSIYDTKKPIIQ